MAKFKITIDSLLDGISPLQYYGKKGSYHAGIGIDPDLPISDNDVRLSGFIRPTAMQKFSSTTIQGKPMFLQTNPKDANCYAYDSTGRAYSIDSSLAVSALNSGNALPGGGGNGLEYYDNYMYFATTTDLTRYGPLDGSASFTNNYWTSTLSKTALSNTIYPTIRGVLMPNHHLHRHTDNKLYMCDVDANGKGILSYVSTTKSSVQGDTNFGSSYKALDFGYGYYPTCSETYGTDLAVALMEGVQTGEKQKPAALSFWDTTSSSFQKLIQVEFPDPLITAMKNVNGVLYVWSGNATGGVRLSRFVGGYSYEEVWYDEQGYPPLAGAVDAEMNRIVWGNVITYPEAAVSVMARGSRSAAVGNGIHNILKSTSTGANGIITAIKYIQTTALNFRQPIVGWGDDSGQGLDKSSTTYGVSVYRSPVYRLGQPFQVSKVRMPLAQAVGANHAATAKIYIDNASSNVTIATINNTVYPNSERNITAYTDGVNGYHDFFLEIRTSGTALMTFALPITIEGETTQD